jgi:hypothetical protein
VRAVAGGGGPIHQTYETKRLASSTTLEGAQCRRGSRKGRTWLVPVDGQLKASRANGADGEAGGGRDAMRYGGRARRGPKP